MKQNKSLQNKDFSFHVRFETIKDLRNVSAEEKLDWLAEANEFVRLFVPPEKRERWMKVLSKTEGNRL